MIGLRVIGLETIGLRMVGLRVVGLKLCYGMCYACYVMLTELS